VTRSQALRALGLTWTDIAEMHAAFIAAINQETRELLASFAS
jgi:hypothetical protein